MRAIGSWISGSDQIGEGVSFLSNQCHWLHDERSMTAPTSGGATEQSGDARVGTVAHRSAAVRALQRTKHDGERGKTKRGSWGCSPRTTNGSASSCGGSPRWGGSSRLGSQRQLAMVNLRLQEDDGELRSRVLDLLQPPIAVSGDRLMRTKRNSWRIGFGLYE
jgi:hypothetical protein